MRICSLVLGVWVYLGALAATGAASAGEPQPFRAGSWQTIRLAHAGIPTIIHFWGLTCAPCRIEMPELGKLAAEHPRVALVTIHAERLPPRPQLVGEMLRDAGLESAENWEFAGSYIERLRLEVDPKWYGELPMTLLISRDGSVQTIVGPADLKAVRSWIATQQ